MEKVFKKIFIKVDEEKRKEIDLLLIESVKRGESFKRLYEDFTEKELTSELWQQVQFYGISDIVEDYKAEQLEYISKQPKSVREVLRANLNATSEEIEKFTRSSNAILAPFNDNSVKITNYIKGKFIVDKTKESKLIESCNIYIDNAIDAEFNELVNGYSKLLQKHSNLLNQFKKICHLNPTDTHQQLYILNQFIDKDDYSVREWFGVPRINHLIEFHKKKNNK